MPKHNTAAHKTVETKPEPQNEVHLSTTAFKAAVFSILFLLIAQLVIAFVAYPSLPARIPSSWLGWAQPGNTIPKWLVFVAFPGSELVVMLLALASPRDEEKRLAMDWGRFTSLILLGLLFLALQVSIFQIIARS